MRNNTHFWPGFRTWCCQLPGSMRKAYAINSAKVPKRYASWILHGERNINSERVLPDEGKTEKCPPPPYFPSEVQSARGLKPGPWVSVWSWSGFRFWVGVCFCGFQVGLASSSSLLPQLDHVANTCVQPTKHHPPPWTVTKTELKWRQVPSGKGQRRALCCASATILKVKSEL